ncbi:unnamed protein product [Caenorhabditis nigoni]
MAVRYQLSLIVVNEGGNERDRIASMMRHLSEWTIQRISRPVDILTPDPTTDANGPTQLPMPHLTATAAS